MRILSKPLSSTPAPSVPMAIARNHPQPVRREVLDAERQVAALFTAATEALRRTYETNCTAPFSAPLWEDAERMENRLRSLLLDATLEADERARIQRCLSHCHLLPGLIRVPTHVCLPMRMLVYVNSGAYLTNLLTEAARAVVAAGEAVAASLLSPTGATVVPALRRHSEAWTAIRAAAIRSGVGCPPIPARVFRAGLIALGVAADTYSALLDESVDPAEPVRLTVA